jgi:hypothetical protein
LFYGRDEVSADRFGKAWRAANLAIESEYDGKAAGDYIDPDYGRPQPRPSVNSPLDALLNRDPNAPTRPDNMWDTSGGRYLG